MLAFLKKRVLGLPQKYRVPVIATAVASPVQLLSRECSGRNAQKAVGTTTVFNQFEQLKKFQHNNHVSESFKPETRNMKDNSKRVSQLSFLVMVSIVSAVTASIVLLLYFSAIASYNQNVPNFSAVSVHPPSIGNTPTILNMLAERAYHVNHRTDHEIHSSPHPHHYITTNALIHAPKFSKSHNHAGFISAPDVYTGAVDRTTSKNRWSAVKQAMKNVVNVVKDIVLAPLELRNEVDFHFL